jgi:periplasmic protein TonB
MNSKAVHLVPPVYPSKAKRKGIEGTVKLHAIVATNGSVKELTVISGEPILAESAVTAVKQWQYKPTLIDNEPVEVDTVITVIFEFPK